MKCICLITTLLITSVVFSQNKIVVPDSVLSYKAKPIMLFLNEQSKGFCYTNGIVLHNYLTPFNSTNFNSATLLKRYNTTNCIQLNPTRNPDPLGAVLQGTLNYLFNNSVNRK